MKGKTESDNPRLLNWRQVCKLLGCKRTHFYQLVNSGRLPAVRVGKLRGVRVEEDAVRRFLAACALKNAL
ncbi:MAG: excisionase family DNA-binding protein [Desulfovibrio sp.]|nr:excisionase family DNA-binding protein [Desulfovibrio sp.]